MKKKDIKKIKASCQKVSDDLKALIKISAGDEGGTKMVTKEDYIEAKTKQMVDFGYGSLTEEVVAEQLEVVLTGKGKKTVIGGFIEMDIIK